MSNTKAVRLNAHVWELLERGDPEGEWLAGELCDFYAKAFIIGEARGMARERESQDRAVDYVLNGGEVEPLRDHVAELAGVVATLKEVVEMDREITRDISDNRRAKLGELPALVDTEEAAKILGLELEAFKSRVKRGQIPKEAIHRTGKKTKPGKRGGNAGRLQFWRDKLINPKGAR